MRNENLELKKIVQENKAKYLRLGYMQREPPPRRPKTEKKDQRRKTHSKHECPGGNKKCSNCAPAVIPAEAIIIGSTEPKEISGAEMIKSLFEPLLPEKNSTESRDEYSEDHYCDERVAIIDYSRY